MEKCSKKAWNTNMSWIHSYLEVVECDEEVWVFVCGRSQEVFSGRPPVHPRGVAPARRRAVHGRAATAARPCCTRRERGLVSGQVGQRSGLVGRLLKKRIWKGQSKLSITKL